MYEIGGEGGWVMQVKKTTHKQRRYAIIHSAVVYVPGLMLMMYNTRELTDFQINRLHADTCVTNGAPD